MYPFFSVTHELPSDPQRLRVSLLKCAECLRMGLLESTKV